MGWLLAAILAVVAFGLMAFVLKVPRRGWEAIGAALMIGIAGYGFQAHAGLRGSPTPAHKQALGDPAAMIAVRQALSGRGAAPAGNWLVVGDALARHGQYADAAGVLLGAIDKNPADAEAWLALANALVGHAEGVLTPPALYAYRRAEAAAPASPGPPFFHGLALAQSGRLGEAREQWMRMLSRAPTDAPWRADMVERLARLDALIIAQAQLAGAGR